MQRSVQVTETTYKNGISILSTIATVASHLLQPWLTKTPQSQKPSRLLHARPSHGTLLHATQNTYKSAIRALLSGRPQETQTPAEAAAAPGTATATLGSGLPRARRSRWAPPHRGATPALPGLPLNPTGSGSRFSAGPRRAPGGSGPACTASRGLAWPEAASPPAPPPPHTGPRASPPCPR